MLEGIGLLAVNTIRDVKSPLERLGLNIANRSPPA